MKNRRDMPKRIKRTKSRRSEKKNGRGIKN